MVTERTTGERVFPRVGHGGFELVGVWMEGCLHPAIQSSNYSRTYEGQSLLLLQLFQLDKIETRESNSAQ